MEYERKGVTITWDIENAKYIRHLHSPVISTDILDGTKWKLEFNLTCGLDYSLIIKREADDDGPKEIELHYEVFTNLFEGASSSNDTIKTCIFQMGKSSKVSYRRVFVNRKLDKCIIRYKIWRQQGSIVRSDHFFVTTRMKTECIDFVSEVESFSDFFEGNRKELKTISTPMCERLVTVNMFLRRRSFFPSEQRFTEINIEFVPKHKKDDRYFFFKFFILDSSRNKTETGKSEGQFISSTYFSLTGVSKEHLTENAEQFLRNDTLSLKCEITFCIGIEYEKVGMTEYETNRITPVEETDLAKTIELLTSKQGVPCNMTLKASTDLFPVHTTILSAQSPVFEAMFNSNMKEAVQKCVQIDDVDSESVKRMLVFLYDGTLEELEWKDAMKLCVAANKYQILTLQQKCTVLLEKSVGFSNCCVLLILADMHQDENLRNTVMSYIVHYAQEVLSCDQWRDLEINLPQLAIETLRELLLDIRKGRNRSQYFKQAQ